MNSAPEAAPLKPGCSLPHPPQCSMSIVLGAKPAQRGWGEDGILGTFAANTVLTWDLVNRSQRLGSELVFCHYWPHDVDVALQSQFPHLEDGANHIYL